MRRAVIVVGAALAVAGCAASLRAVRTEHAKLVAKEIPPETPAAGWEACVDCHSTIAEYYASSIHAKNPGCETCHGNGDAHIADVPENIVGREELQALSARGRAEMCQQCHAEKRGTFPASHHGRAGVACETCHPEAVHFEQDDAVKPAEHFAGSTEFCSQCHAAQAADFELPYRHPLEPGGCETCHDPHGDRRGVTADEGCVRCHADAAAPRVFRHAAMDEGCSACHVPHGSAFPTLLPADGNALCLNCHFDAAFPVIENVDHSTFLASKARCWDCHVEVHGSNSDPTLLGRIR